MAALTRCSFAVVAVGVATLAAAHHNSAPLFDFSKSITVEGTVVEFQFINPHARIRFVAGPPASTEEWLAEGANAVALRHNGWTGEEFKPGDRITVTGAPARDGSRRMEWREVIAADGRALGGGNNFRTETDELFERLEQQRREALEPD
jgi:hypothetical protein